MTATYTFDIFTSLNGFGAHSGDWGKQGPEFLELLPGAGHAVWIDDPEHAAKVTISFLGTGG